MDKIFKNGGDDRTHLVILGCLQKRLPNWCKEWVNKYLDSKNIMIMCTPQDMRDEFPENPPPDLDFYSKISWYHQIVTSRELSQN